MITKGRGHSNTETSTSSQHIYMSVHKARRMVDQIRGRSYEETLKILELMPYRVCYLILKLVYSTAANANNNRGFNKEALIISKVEINEGITVKKLKPQARGRSFSIKRSTCHITIVVKDISLYKYNEYCIWFNKAKWLYKKKYRDMTCHDMSSSGDIWDKK